MDLTRKRDRSCRLLADASINLEAVSLAGERYLSFTHQGDTAPRFSPAASPITGVTSTLNTQLGAKELVFAVSDLQAARQVRGQGSQ